MILKTLCRRIRKYVDPNCNIDHQAIGHGNSSHTRDVQIESIETNFPDYCLYDTKPRYKFSFDALLSEDSPEERKVDNSELLCPPTFMQYKRNIDRIDGLVVREDETQRSTKCNINIYDTPGLDDTNGHDERHMAKLLSALLSTEAIHLVLITISRHTPMTPGLQAALMTYSKVFSAMGGLIAFVHTNVDFKTQHHQNTKLTNFLQERKDDLEKIMARNIPHFLIDCDLDEDRPIYLYLRQRTIRSLLLLTRLNVPVPLNKMQLCKTKRMTEIDDLIVSEYEKGLRNVEKESAQLEKSIINIDLSINEARYSIRELCERLNNDNTEDLEIIDERRLDEHWDLFAFRQEKVLEASNLKYIIDDIHVEQSGIEIKEIQGGVGKNHWSVKLIRQFFQHGTYHAKLYARRRQKRRLKINEDERKLEDSRKTLDALIEQRKTLDGVDSPEDATLTQRQQLLAKHNQCLNLITRASRPTLHLNLFKTIAEAGVYEGDIVQCVKRVAAFYSEYVPGEHEEASL
ncbi:hypothetical protein EDD11_005537 [Mortierella claussenii]|nr:hypothetical protein EDD11_005537 [Mortierella claussenii]